MLLKIQNKVCSWRKILVVVESIQEGNYSLIQSVVIYGDCFPHVCVRVYVCVYVYPHLLGGEGRATALSRGWKGIFWVDPLGQKIPFQILSCSSFAFEAPERWGKRGVEPDWRALLALTPGTCDFAIVWSLFTPQDLYPVLRSCSSATMIRAWVGQNYSDLDWSSSGIFVCIPSREFW